MNLYFTNESSSDFFINDKDINVISKINTDIINSNSDNNIDCILQSDGGSSYSKNEADLIKYADLENITVMGIPRIPKQTQAYLLNKFNIFTPHTYYRDRYSQNSLLSLLKYYKNHELFILKMLTGARGFGQILLTKEQYLKLLDCEQNNVELYINNFDNNDNVDYKKEEAVYELEGIKPVVTSPEKNEVLVDSVSTNDKIQEMIESIGTVKVNNSRYISNLDSGYIVQEYLQFKNEYRLLWFYGQDPIFIKREKDTGNWQANACNNKVNSSYVIHYPVEINKLNDIFSDTLSKISDMCNYLNIPYLSLDLFQTYHNSTGVLEFQMEFGYSKTIGIDLSLLNSKIVNSVKKLYNDKNE